MQLHHCSTVFFLVDDALADGISTISLSIPERTYFWSTYSYLVYRCASSPFPEKPWSYRETLPRFRGEVFEFETTRVTVVTFCILLLTPSPTDSPSFKTSSENCGELRKEYSLKLFSFFFFFSGGVFTNLAGRCIAA